MCDVNQIIPEEEQGVQASPSIVQPLDPDFCPFDGDECPFSGKSADLYSRFSAGRGEEGDHYGPLPTEEYLKERVEDLLRMPVEQSDTFPILTQAGMSLRTVGRCQPSLRKELLCLREFMRTSKPLTRKDRHQARMALREMGLHWDGMYEPTKEEIAELVVNRWASGSHEQQGLLKKVNINLPFTPDVSPTNELWRVGNRQMLKGNLFPSDTLARLNLRARQAPFRVTAKTQLGLLGTNHHYVRLMNVRRRMQEITRKSPLDGGSGTNSGTKSLGVLKSLAATTKEALIDHSIKVPSMYHLCAGYLRAVYTTDQDTRCGYMHSACTVCAACDKRVLCEFRYCEECNAALGLTVTDIIGEDFIKDGGTIWNVNDIKDILYYQLVALCSGPARHYARYPLARTGFKHDEVFKKIGPSGLRTHENIEAIWPAMHNRKGNSPDLTQMGANPYYSKEGICHECHENFEKTEVKNYALSYLRPSMSLWDTKVTQEHHAHMSPITRRDVMISKKPIIFKRCKDHDRIGNVPLPAIRIATEHWDLIKIIDRKVLETMNSEEVGTIILNDTPTIQESMSKARTAGIIGKRRRPAPRKQPLDWTLDPNIAQTFNTTEDGDNKHLTHPEADCWPIDLRGTIKCCETIRDGMISCVSAIGFFE